MACMIVNYEALIFTLLIVSAVFPLAWMSNCGGLWLMNINKIIIKEYYHTTNNNYKRG